MVPASHCAMQYISDPQNLPGDENSIKARSLGAKEASIECRAAAVRSYEAHGKQQTLQVFTLRKIRTDEKLSVDSHMKYWLK